MRRRNPWQDAWSPDAALLGAGGVSGYTINHTPRGSVETKGEWQLDLQVTKGFKLGAMEVEGMLTVYNLFSQELEASFNSTAFRQATETDPETGRSRGLVYQDDDPSAPYYDEHYGADSSPVLMPIGEPTSYYQPRRYEIGVRLEF